MLTLDVEFLLGVCFAARSPSDPEPDWPPQPDRVFSALVATWAARGQPEKEKQALEWLERQRPPTLFAPEASRRSAATVFVPPNDARGTQIPALPSRRKRQERRFPAVVPMDGIVSYSWTHAEPDSTMLESLQALAHDTSYLGHSSSLVRCYFHQTTDDMQGAGVPARVNTYPGRLGELSVAFKEGRRPAPGETVRAQTDATGSRVSTAPIHAQSVFGTDWLVLGHAGGPCPDLRGVAVVARALRSAILCGFSGTPAPESICGHKYDGSASSVPHMAIFPLANVGWKWSDGGLMGLAVCMPRQTRPDERRALFQALATIIRARGSEEHQELEVGLPGGETWRLVLQMEPAVSSLKPMRYQRAASIWATATPIALDRHPKAKSPVELQAETADLICAACARIGLPKPAVVVPGKHSAIRGSEPAIPSPRSPRWMRWALPESLAGRVLTHATLVFEEPVQGPIALGAGRFLGLGICLPLDVESHT